MNIIHSGWLVYWTKRSLDLISFNIYELSEEEKSALAYILSASSIQDTRTSAWPAAYKRYPQASCNNR